MTSKPNDHVDLRTFPGQFSTADLPDEVVNQRALVTVAVGNRVGDDGNRRGRSGISVWMDGEASSGEVGGSVGTFPPSSYRGQSSEGLRLTDDERRYLAACLYAAALNLIEHRNEVFGAQDQGPPTPRGSSTAGEPAASRPDRAWRLRSASGK